MSQIRNSVVALIPMRHHSERVKGKNYRDFAGRPLFHYITRTLLDCPLISQVAIDTDSTTITEYVSKHFRGVDIIERPEHLRDGEIPMNDIILHDISVTDSEFYLQTHSTNPLLR
ncbi:MAG: acylneuraminate cytidylyltransferase family protein, partial [Nitrosopumilaceae archaeon]|nr:acylneuraminate cytidylyltransferase family protein [Nitrosopumilaceae archaeon]